MDESRGAASESKVIVEEERFDSLGAWRVWFSSSESGRWIGGGRGRPKRSYPNSTTRFVLLCMFFLCFFFVLLLLSLGLECIDMRSASLSVLSGSTSSPWSSSGRARGMRYTCAAGSVVLLLARRESVDGDEIGEKQGKQEETAIWNLSDQEKFVVIGSVVGGRREAQQLVQSAADFCYYF